MKKLLLALVAFFALSFGAFAAVNLNTATKEELDTVKGIGPVKAQAIIDYRQAHGPFKSVDELKNVKGFGEKSVAKMRPELTVTGATMVRSEPAPVDRAQPAKAEPAPSEKPQPGKMEPAHGAQPQPAQPAKAEVKPHDKAAKAGKAGNKDEAKQGGEEQKGKQDKQSKKDKKKAQKDKKKAQKEQKDKKKGKDGKPDQK